MKNPKNGQDVVIAIAPGKEAAFEAYKLRIANDRAEKAIYDFIIEVAEWTQIRLSWGGKTFEEVIEDNINRTSESQGFSFGMEFWGVMRLMCYWEMGEQLKNWWMLRNPNHTQQLDEKLAQMMGESVS